MVILISHVPSTAVFRGVHRRTLRVDQNEVHGTGRRCGAPEHGLGEIWARGMIIWLRPLSILVSKRACGKVEKPLQLHPRLELRCSLVRLPRVKPGERPGKRSLSYAVSAIRSCFYFARVENARLLRRPSEPVRRRRGLLEKGSREDNAGLPQWQGVPVFISSASSSSRAWSAALFANRLVEIRCCTSTRRTDSSEPRRQFLSSSSVSDKCDSRTSGSRPKLFGILSVRCPHHAAVDTSVNPFRGYEIATPVVTCHSLVALIRLRIMTAVTLSIKILPNGRMSLPADIRRRLGVTGGGELLVEETDEGLLIMTTSQAVARAQAISRRLVAETNSSVDDFLAERNTWQE